MTLCCFDDRRQYLSNAVLQAKSASGSDGLNRGAIDNGLLDLLEGKLAVLQFQIKIQEELESIASRLEASHESESVANGSTPNNGQSDNASFIAALRDKKKELSLDLKTITQLYNDYAVPFELWEVSDSLKPLQRLNCIYAVKTSKYRVASSILKLLFALPLLNAFS